MELFGFLFVVLSISGRQFDTQSQLVRQLEGCGESDVSVDSDEECVSLKPIPQYDDTPGSIIQYKCKFRISTLPKAKIDFCPIQICQDNLTWSMPSLSCAESECVSVDKPYQGRRICSQSGLICQPWSSQSPHKHNFTLTSSFPDHSIMAASNYCRDPDGFNGSPWCFTQDPNIEWELCGIPECDEMPVEDNSCPKTAVDCGMPNFEVEADNNCVSLSPLQPFHTTEGSIIVYACASLQQGIQSNTGYCPVEVCQENGRWRTPRVSCAETECFINGRSRDYNGQRTCTSDGIECIEWQERQKLPFDDTSFPDGSIIAARAFCRDPHGEMGAPWCYTDKTSNSWGYCDIPSCTDIAVEKTECTGVTYTTDSIRASSDNTDNPDILLSTITITLTSINDKQLSTTVNNKQLSSALPSMSTTVLTISTNDKSLKSTNFILSNSDGDSPSTIAENKPQVISTSEFWNTVGLGVTAKPTSSSFSTKNPYSTKKVSATSSVSPADYTKTTGSDNIPPKSTQMSNTRETTYSYSLTKSTSVYIKDNAVGFEMLPATSTSVENTERMIGSDTLPATSTSIYNTERIVGSDTLPATSASVDNTERIVGSDTLLATSTSFDNTERMIRSVTLPVTSTSFENTERMIGSNTLLAMSSSFENTESVGSVMLPAMSTSVGNTERMIESDMLLTTSTSVDNTERMIGFDTFPTSISVDNSDELNRSDMSMATLIATENTEWNSVSYMTQTTSTTTLSTEIMPAYNTLLSTSQSSININTAMNVDSDTLLMPTTKIGTLGFNTLLTSSLIDDTERSFDSEMLTVTSTSAINTEIILQATSTSMVVSDTLQAISSSPINVDRTIDSDNVLTTSTAMYNTEKTFTSDKLLMLTTTDSIFNTDRTFVFDLSLMPTTPNAMENIDRKTSSDMLSEPSVSKINREKTDGSDTFVYNTERVDSTILTSIDNGEKTIGSDMSTATATFSFNTGKTFGPDTLPVTLTSVEGRESTIGSDTLPGTLTSFGIRESTIGSDTLPGTLTSVGSRESTIGSDTLPGTLTSVGSRESRIGSDTLLPTTALTYKNEGTTGSDMLPMLSTLIDNTERTLGSDKSSTTSKPIGNVASKSINNTEISIGSDTLVTRLTSMLNSGGTLGSSTLLVSTVLENTEQTIGSNTLMMISTSVDNKETTIWSEKVMMTSTSVDSGDRTTGSNRLPVISTSIDSKDKDKSSDKLTMSTTSPVITERMLLMSSTSSTIDRTSSKRGSDTSSATSNPFGNTEMTIGSDTLLMSSISTDETQNIIGSDLYTISATSTTVDNTEMTIGSDTLLATSTSTDKTKEMIGSDLETKRSTSNRVNNTEMTIGADTLLTASISNDETEKMIGSDLYTITSTSNRVDNTEMTDDLPMTSAFQDNSIHVTESTRSTATSYLKSTDRAFEKENVTVRPVYLTVDKGEHADTTRMMHSIDNVTDITVGNMHDNKGNSASDYTRLTNNIDNVTDIKNNMPDNKENHAYNNTKMTQNTSNMADTDRLLTNTKFSVALQTFDQALPGGKIYLSDVDVDIQLSNEKSCESLFEGIISSVKMNSGENIDIEHMTSTCTKTEQIDNVNEQNGFVESGTVSNSSDSGDRLFSKKPFINGELLSERHSHSQQRVNVYITPFQSIMSFIRISGEIVGVSVIANISGKSNMVDCARDCGKNIMCSLFKHHMDSCVLVTLNSTNGISLNCDTTFSCFLKLQKKF